MSEIKTPTDRLAYEGDITPYIKQLCTYFDIGNFCNATVIEVGYEDCNVIVETDQAKFVAKLFSKNRTAEEIARYVTIMEKVIEAGVSHPALLKTTLGDAIFYSGGLSCVLMPFVKGKTFYELDRAPDEAELKEVIEQAKKINAIDYKPEYLFDSWAIPNIKIMLEKVRQFVAPDNLGLAEEAVKRYEAIPIDDLPHTFVHGDLTKANVMKTGDNKICVFDFSVANWYPRIQELAVITANLLYDKTNQCSLQELCEIVADEYGSLTPQERQYLSAYALAGIAMEFLGAHQEKYINGIDNEENNYWMNLGREGLQKALAINQ
ncbi:MAG: phosphotransferase [Candidatus Saccharimonadales bacterium]